MARRLALIVLMAVAVAWGAALLAAPLIRDGTPGRPPGSAGEVSGRHPFGPLTRLAALTYGIGALVCHQRPERSFHLAGAQLPVCARCVALYWGGAAGVLVWLLLRRRHAAAAPARRTPHAPAGGLAAANARATAFRRALIAAAIPVAITVATAAAGLWDPSNVWRALLSAPLGVTIGSLLAAVTLKDLR